MDRFTTTPAGSTQPDRHPDDEVAYRAGYVAGFAVALNRTRARCAPALWLKACRFLAGPLARWLCSEPDRQIPPPQFAEYRQGRAQDGE